MKIRIVCVGKLKERFWKDAEREYLKRLSSYADVEVLEVVDCDPDRCGGEARARETEALTILKALPDAAHVILLAIEGCSLSSEDFSKHLDELTVSGQSSFCFVIGGSTGVAPSIYERADERLSLGAITLPHNLARIVVLEQIYRAFRISRGEPYHK